MNKTIILVYYKDMTQRNYFEYLTYSDKDRDWGIVCTDIGTNEIKPNEAYPPQVQKHPRSFKNVSKGRILNEYQIIYITKGKGSFSSYEKTYQVNGGTIMLLFPGIRHSYQPDIATGWNEYWVGCIGNTLDALVQNNVLSPSQPIFHLGLHDTILSIYHDIFNRVKLQRPGYQLRLGASIMMLLADIIGYTRQSNQRDYSDTVVDKAKFLFTENIMGNIEIEQISNHLGISISHLTNIFKSYTGMTPYQYYINLKINKAKELLETRKYSVKEVAYELSFESQYYFSRLFKKKTGVPPSHWAVFDNDSSEYQQ